MGKSRRHPRWQLGQRVELRFACVELEQLADEFEQQHCGPGRL